MPESDQIPTNDKAVLGFCELWALFFGLPAGEALYRGDPITPRMVIFVLIASVFAAFGPAWPYVKSRFPRRLSTTFVRAASDFRWWMVTLVLAFIYLATPMVARRITPSAEAPSSRTVTRSAVISAPGTVSGSVSTQAPPGTLSSNWKAGLAGAGLTALVFLIAAFVRRPHRHDGPASGTAARKPESESPVKLLIKNRKLDPRPPDTDKTITFRAKVILTFTNESGRPIGVTLPRWVRGADGVGLQAPLTRGAYYYRVANRSGIVEVERAYIDANESFDLWIALDPSVPDEELRKRLAENRLGKLIIATMDNQVLPFDI